MRALYEIYIVKEDNFSIYKIANSILYNKTDLDISVNNINLIKNTDYILQDEELIFLNPLSIADKIIIKDSILDNVKLITKNSYSQNALFKYYTSNAKLKSNQIYSFNINVHGADNTGKFLSKYSPFYSTIDKIRMDTGDLLNNVSDTQIAKIIYLNSKEALEKLEEAVESDTADKSTLTKTPTYAKNYVRYKTNIDFCYAIYLSISGKYGTQTKKIGDIQIENTVKLPYIDSMIARFKELLKPNADAFGGVSKTTTATFVRANKTSYPVDRTAVF